MRGKGRGNGMWNGGGGVGGGARPVDSQRCRETNSKLSEETVTVAPRSWEGYPGLHRLRGSWLEVAGDCIVKVTSQNLMQDYTVNTETGHRSVTPVDEDRLKLLYQSCNQMI